LPVVKRLFLVVMVGLVGCKKPAGEVSPNGAPAAEGQRPATGWSDAKVREYLRYQRGLVELITPTELPDGGVSIPPVRSDEEMARLEAGLRRVSGLTDAEITVLGRATGALFTRRTLIKMNEIGSMQKELQRARTEVPDGSVPEVDAALVVEEERQKRQAAYTEERAKFGDALIDVLVPHEQELISNWTAMMNSAADYAEAREDRK
jgi:hypothetical protein